MDSSTLGGDASAVYSGHFLININSVNELEVAMKKALDNDAVKKKEIVRQYLHDRTPEIFVSSLLQNFEKTPIH